MSVRKLSSEHFDNCDYFGDKLVIHKCVINAAIKRIKHDPAPSGEVGVRRGQISILEELHDLIERGHRIEIERFLKSFNKETK